VLAVAKSHYPAVRFEKVGSGVAKETSEAKEATTKLLTFLVRRRVGSTLCVTGPVIYATLTVMKLSWSALRRILVALALLAFLAANRG